VRVPALCGENGQRRGLEETSVGRAVRAGGGTGGDQCPHRIQARSPTLVQGTGVVSAGRFPTGQVGSLDIDLKVEQVTQALG
jgi:hypothetical protein